MAVMPTWYHRTCTHSATRIEEDGLVLRAHPQVMLSDLSIIWLTPTRSATAADLGLASHEIVSCNRMECLFEVVAEDAEKVTWWGDFKRIPEIAPLLPFIRLLERTRGTKPGMWAISAGPLRVVRVE